MTDPEGAVDAALQRFEPAADDERKAFGAPASAKSRMDKIREDDAAQTVKLKKMLAIGTFIAIGAQLLIADLAFFRYGKANKWEIDTAVMITWLSATVIEVLGVVVIIARHLFPKSTTD